MSLACNLELDLFEVILIISFKIQMRCLIQTKFQYFHSSLIFIACLSLSRLNKFNGFIMASRRSKIKSHNGIELTFMMGFFLSKRKFISDMKDMSEWEICESKILLVTCLTCITTHYLRLPKFFVFRMPKQRRKKRCELSYDVWRQIFPFISFLKLFVY